MYTQPRFRVREIASEGAFDGNNRWWELTIRECPKDFEMKEEYEAYTKTIRESRGYTVPDLGKLRGSFMPDIYSDSSTGHMDELAQIALEGFNKEHSTCYKLRKVDRVNFELLGSFTLFYITFMAMKDSVEEFQTKVLMQCSDVEVLECQINPAASGSS